MTTISVPLSADLLSKTEYLISIGVATNKADAMRKALEKFTEDQAVEAVLKARKEPRLSGDLDELLKVI